MVRRRLFLFALLMLSFFGPVLAENIQVTSSFDKRTARVNEEIHLKIKISGAQGNVQAPRLPAFKEFDSFYTGRASHITFVNNVTTSTVEFTYVLVPKAAGTFTLSPIQVTAGGQTFQTDPIQIQVLENQGGAVSSQQQPVPPGTGSGPGPSSGSMAQEPPPTFRPDDDNIFVKATVDKTTVYPNEQILLTYSLYTRYDTRYEGFDEEPQVSGFWIEEFPMDREVGHETVRIDGKRYIKADIKKIALFPTEAAEYTIHPGTLKVSVRQEPQNSSIFDEFFNDSFFSGGSFFARRENRLLKPPQILITAKPLPEQGKPADFNGAVGNFRMSASVDKQTVKQNEPVTMKIVIEGEGNIETLNKPPAPEIPDFKIYDSDTSSQLFKTGDVIGGRKNFEIILIPIRAGKFVIPKLSFSFFNPYSRQYQTLQTPEFPLNVEPSDQKFELPKALSQQDLFKKDIQLEAKDILYIREKLPDGNSGKILDVVYRVFFAAGMLAALAVAIALWRDRKEKIYAKDHGLKRRKLARSMAESKLRRLKAGARSNKDNAGAYFEEIEKILTQYLSDKFNLSAYGTTRMDLQEQLRETLGADNPLHQNISELYLICDESRFAKGTIPSDIRDNALKILRDTIERVEKRVK